MGKKQMGILGLNAKTCLTALVVVLGLVPDRSQAGEQVPYKDRVSARILGAEPISATMVRLPFEVVRGQATIVGRFTSLGELFVDLDSLLFTGVNTISAANGDEIFIGIIGGLTPTADPAVFIIEVDTEFVGGTGRFEGATGGFLGAGELTLGPGGQLVGATFVGIGEGTISSPGSNKRP